ncbi:MAG: hypothetical protein SGARI_006278, partial [Bacillariaceae sp.]
MVDENKESGDAASEQDQSERGSNDILVSSDHILELTAPGDDTGHDDDDDQPAASKLGKETKTPVVDQTVARSCQTVPALVDETGDETTVVTEATNIDAEADLIASILKSSSHPDTTPLETTNEKMQSLTVTSLERGSGMPAQVGAVRISGTDIAATALVEIDDPAEHQETAPTAHDPSLPVQAELAQDIEHQVYHKIISNAAVGQVVKGKNMCNRRLLWKLAAFVGIVLVIA